MRGSLASRRCFIALIALAAALLAPLVTPIRSSGAARAETAGIAVPKPKPAPARDLQARVKIYREKLKAYEKARKIHETRSAPYWRQITAKRTLRRRKRAKGEKITLEDYVLEQPPLYSGPPKPVDPRAKPGAGLDIPVVADFLENAKKHFGFVPHTPTREIDFKRAYAKAAAAEGLAKRTCVKIYGFEATGNGTYDVQAGLEYGRPEEQAISTALGYNQLLTPNTIGLVAQHGDKILEALRAKAAAASPERRAELQKKIDAFAKMLRFTRSVKQDWYKHVRLGQTDKGLGVHALNLDVDIGPMLQVHKLLDSVRFARHYGQTQPLAAAELEMMNLTGDGNGIDMVLMPQAMREKVPTANFFQQRGYERNPVAIRNNTVAQLIAATDAKMEKEAQLPGAKELAAAFDAFAQRGE